MESAFGNESKHVSDKTSRLTVSDKQKTSYEVAAQSTKTQINQLKLGSACTFIEAYV